jgi:predicted PurR-regulated permease PerM
VGRTSTSLVVIAALVVIVAGIKAAQPLVVPFLLATFIATIAATPVFWLEQRRVPAAVAILVVMIAIVVVLLGVGALAAQSVGEFTAKLPFYQERLTLLLQDVVTRLEPFGVEVSNDVLLSYFNPGTALAMAGNTLRGLGEVLSNGFLILLTVIFILAEASSFPRKLREVLKHPDRDMAYFARFASNVNRYIAIKTSVSIATGVIVGVALALLGVDFPVLWGLIAFLLNYVPTIGSIIAAVPALLLALVQLGPGTAALAALVYVVVNLVMGNGVEPRYMGRGLGLSTLVVFLSLVFWGWMLGPVGMLLSVPLTMTAKIALEANPSTQWLALMLGPAEATRTPQLQSTGDGQAAPQP